MKNKVIVDSLSRKWKRKMKRLSSKKDRQQKIRYLTVNKDRYYGKSEEISTGENSA